MIDMVLIHWANLPLDDESNRISTIKNSDYNEAIKKDMTSELENRLRIIAPSDFNIILSIFGSQGSGKSRVFLYLAHFLSKLYGKRIKIDNIHFNRHEMLNKIEKAEAHDVHILDEQVKTFGMGAGAEVATLESIEKTIRKKGISLFFSSPDFERHNFHFYLETWQMGAEKEWDFTKDIHSQWKYTKSIIYDRRDHPLGFVVTGNAPDKKLIAEYEAKKDEFIKMIVQRQTSGRWQFIEEMTNFLLNNNDFMYDVVFARNKQLLTILVIRYLKGRAITSAEIGLITAEIQYKLNYNPVYVAKKTKVIKERISEIREMRGEATEKDLSSKTQ